jgi:hypothetical protein
MLAAQGVDPIRGTFAPERSWGGRVVGVIDRVTYSRRRFAVVTGVAIWLVSSAVLLLGHGVAMADNGDYERLVCTWRLQPNLGGPAAPSRYFLDAIPTWKTGGPPCAYSYHSSERAVLAVARWISPLTGSAFDLRVVGAVHCFLLGLVCGFLAYLVPGRRRLKTMLQVLFAFVVLDTSSTGYFVSAYSEPIVLLAGIALVASWMMPTRSPVQLVTRQAAVAGSAYLLATAKPQTWPLGVVLAAAVVLRPWTDRPRANDRVMARVTATVLAAGLVLGSMSYGRSVPDELRKSGVHAAIIYSGLRFSENPASDLRSVGLSTGLQVFKGRPTFAPNSGLANPLFAASWRNVSELDLATFQLRHPVSTMRLWALASRRLLDGRPKEIGTTIRQGSAAVQRSACRWCLARSLTRGVSPLGPVLVPGAALALALWANRLRRRHGDPNPVGRALAEVSLLSVVLSGVSFAIAVVGSGYYELTKHLYVAGVFAALAMWSAVASRSVSAPEVSPRGV